MKIDIDQECRVPTVTHEIHTETHGVCSDKKKDKADSLVRDDTPDSKEQKSKLDLISRQGRHITTAPTAEQI